MKDEQLRFHSSKNPNELEKRIYRLQNDHMMVWRSEKEKMSLNPKIEPYMIIPIKEFKKIFPWY